MKKLLILAGICLAGILMAGCTKEEIKENKLTIGNYSSPVTVGVMLSSEMNHHVGGPGYHLDMDATLNGVSCPLFINASASCKGKKVNLGKFDSGVNYHFEINSDASAGYPFDVHQYNEPGMGSEIEHSSAGTWFKSGTMEINDDGKNISIKAEGALQDGRNFSLKAKGPKTTE